MKVLTRYRRKIRDHPEFERIARYYGLGLPLSYLCRHFGGPQRLYLSTTQRAIEKWVISPHLLRHCFRRTQWEKKRREHLRLKKQVPSVYTETYLQEVFWEGIDYDHLKQVAKDAGRWRPRTPAELHGMLDRYSVALSGDRYPISDAQKQQQSDEAFLYVFSRLPEESQRQRFARTHRLPGLSLERIGRWRQIANEADTRSPQYRYARKMLQGLARSESRHGGRRYDHNAIVALAESCYWYAAAFAARLRLLDLSIKELDEILQQNNHPLAERVRGSVASSWSQYIKRAGTSSPNFARRELIRLEFPEVVQKFPSEVLRMHRWGKRRIAIHLCAALINVSTGRVKSAIRACRTKPA